MILIEKKRLEEERYAKEVQDRTAKELAKAEEERLAKSKAEQERRQADMERKQRQNLLGARSLQDEEIEGFGGYRRKNLGKSIRS